MEHDGENYEEAQFVGGGNEIEQPVPRREPVGGLHASGGIHSVRAGGATSPSPLQQRGPRTAAVNMISSSSGAGGGSRQGPREVHVTVSQEHEDEDMDDDLNFTAMENGGARVNSVRGRGGRVGRACSGNYYLGNCYSSSQSWS